MKIRKKDNQALTPELGNRSVISPAWKPFFRAARRFQGTIFSKLKIGPLMVDASISKLMIELHNDGRSTYRVVFVTGPPNFQYQNEKRWAANQRFCSMNVQKILVG